MKAKLKNARISPKKVYTVASMIRNKSALEALDILEFTDKKGAKILKKLLDSAVANASNNFSRNAESLKISTLIINKGVTYKRSISGSRGRVNRISKRTTNIFLFLV